MDLPTYTSIWRIEKRLYKLYDFRLPMPVPVGQIAVFAAITVPYVIILTVLGLPFSHTLFWLYVLPPGLLTWLATRPVLESKRLPELIISQVRYLGEPGTWCRMTPLAGKDEIVVVGRVWRKTAEPEPAEVPAPARRPLPARARPAHAVAPARAVAPSRAAAPATARATGPTAPPVARPGQAGRPGPARPAAAPRVPGPSRTPVPGRAPVQVPVPPPAPLSRPVAFGQPATDGPAAAPEYAPSVPAVPPAPVAQPVSLAPPLPVVEPPPPAQPRPDGQTRPADHAAPARRTRWPGTPDQPGLPPVAPTARPAPAESATPGKPSGPADQPGAAGPAAPAAVPLTRMPGLPEIAHDDRHGAPRRAVAAGPPDPATSQRPAAPAPAETPRPGWPLAQPAPAQPAADRPQDEPPAPAAPASFGRDAEQGAAPATPHLPAAAVAPASAQAFREAPAARPPQAPAEAQPEAPAAVRPLAAAEASPQAPAAQPPQATAQAAPPAPAAAVPQPPAQAAPPAPAVTFPQAPAEGAAPPPKAESPVPPVSSTPGAIAQPAAFSTPDASAATPEAPPADPATPSPPTPPTQPTPPVVVVRGSNTTRPTAVERAIGAPGQLRGGTSWREHVRVVPGGHGPGRPDMERRDRARVLLPIRGSRLIVVLGCTVGAGQSVTTLMLADVLASLRTEPVAALDLNPGQTSLTELADSTPAATARGLLGGQPATSPHEPGQLDLITHDSVTDARPDLGDAEYTRLIRILATQYPLTLADPGATAVARVLAAADQLVLVAPASADAAQAVTMTMEWLDGHGYSDLVSNAIAVINGVSKRSMSHVEQAELVVRGRCRATIRVPWDDHLGAPPDEQHPSDTAGASRFGQLRPPVQHAYTALAGVLVSALAVEPARPHGAAT